ncbi:MAG TPA: chemotaxis response regulator protein-glutamate methylesterase [Calditrichia bacterium]|nr:chemotaxis response regulator protein-glutamate methylesterase [Calditrichia bacterium]
MAEPVRTLIVDDSSVVRQTMKAILEEDAGIRVIDTASDPFIAAQKIRKEVPDVILLDIEMPRMDGLTFLQKIMTQHPIPVVICSTLVDSHSDSSIKALELGAVDLIQKPKLGTKKFIEESGMRIRDVVKAASQAKIKRATRRVVHEEPPKTPTKKLSADAVLQRGAAPMNITTTEKILVIGASTGGVEAIRTLLEKMPADAPGIVITQHMPEKFTKSFADRMDSLSQMTVKEAEDNDTVVRGRALIAPGNRHMLLKRSGARYFVELKDGPLVSRHRPSVDVLFRSAARYAGKNAIGIILTGMGSDGALGMKEMFDAGATNIAQDEASCVVFGMPKEAIKHGGTHHVLPLDKITDFVLDLAGK